jgi:hypothetical protein
LRNQGSDLYSLQISPSDQISLVAKQAISLDPNSNKATKFLGKGGLNKIRNILYTQQSNTHPNKSSSDNRLNTPSELNAQHQENVQIESQNVEQSGIGLNIQTDTADKTDLNEHICNDKPPTLPTLQIEEKVSEAIIVESQEMKKVINPAIQEQSSLNTIETDFVNTNTHSPNANSHPTNYPGYRNYSKKDNLSNSNTGSPKQQQPFNRFGGKQGSNFGSPKSNQDSFDQFQNNPRSPKSNSRSNRGNKSGYGRGGYSGNNNNSCKTDGEKVNFRPNRRDDDDHHDESRGGSRGANVCSRYNRFLNEKFNFFISYSKFIFIAFYDIFRNNGASNHSGYTGGQGNSGHTGGNRYRQQQDWHIGEESEYYFETGQDEGMWNEDYEHDYSSLNDVNIGD